MSGKRTYKVRGSFLGGDLTLRVDDAVGPMINDIAKKYPGIARRALRHTGFVVQRDMKNDLATGKGTSKQSVLKPSVRAAFQAQRTLRGKKIAKSPHLPHRLKKSTTHHGMLKKHLRRDNRWMGSTVSKNRYMARAIGFDNKTNKDAVSIGWLSPSAARWGRILQTGKSQRVTKKTRRYFAAIGIPLKETTKTIRVKPDRFMPKYYRRNKRVMAQVFSQRFLLKYRQMTEKRTA